MKTWIITLMLLLGWSAAQAQSDTTGLVRVDSDEVEVWVPDMANTNSKQEVKAKKRGQKYYTFDDLIEKYGSREGFRSVIFGRKMMQMMADRVKSEDRELSDLLKGIYAIKAISTSQPCPEFVTDMKTWPETRIHVSLISQVEQNGQWTSCYLVDGGRWELSTFVLLSYGGKEETALLITGYFSVKDISRLASIRPK
ncbi:MAG: DUF4252 domain-containing protein [Rikenellaceae bacterium]|nr:DUF4252 domain-containing protein [Rikenellaceae bacterium]